ncbi:hypothetical protein Vafri_5498 [Volvox africanus]|uniref:Uncharacterized protein n=1 Tax=Volvox africanus TaxID=51714 RepID=A0A8J4B054_9CHLO|nr:hypothetical protein Vafri_5498 [Volvox africanus]
MGKLVPTKSSHISTIPSFETDVHKLIDNFVLKVERNDETKFSIFKQIWRECSFSFIHQAVPLNIPAGDFLQLLYAVALNRLVDPSPYLNYRADPGELTGTACCNAIPAEAGDALGQLAGEVGVGAHRGMGARSCADAEQISPGHRAAIGAPAAAQIDPLRSNTNSGRNSGAAGLAAAEEDPLDQECDLLAHLDELCSDLFQEHQVQHHTDHGQPFSMSSHAHALQHSLCGAAGKNTPSGLLNVALGGQMLPSQILAGPQQHATAACFSAGSNGALKGFQERPTSKPPPAGPELSLLLAMIPGCHLNSQREQQQLQQQQQQQSRGAEDSYASCDPLMGGNAEGIELQQRGQDVAPCTQLLPSALTVARANGSLDAVLGPGPISHGLAEEDDYDDVLMDGVPDKPSVLLSSTWGNAQPATSQAADLPPRNVPNLKVQCNEPADGDMPGPQHTVDRVEEAHDNLMPMNGLSDLQAAAAAAASERTPEALMSPVRAELAPLTASPGGCGIALMEGSPGGLSVDLVGMGLASHSSGPFKGSFSPIRSCGVSPSPLKGLAFLATRQATPEVSPPTPSSLKGSPGSALRTLHTPTQLQSPHSQMREPDKANAACALPGAAEPSDSAATQLHTAVAAAGDAFVFVAPTMSRIDATDVAKGRAASGIHSPEPHAILTDAQSRGWAAQGLPPPPQQQQQQQQPALPWVMQAPCGGPTQPISDSGDTATALRESTLAAAEGSARAADAGCNRMMDRWKKRWEAMVPTKAATSGAPGADAGAMGPKGPSDDAALGAPLGPTDGRPPPVSSSMQILETANPNSNSNPDLDPQQQPTLPAAPPLPGPDVPLAARVGAIYALYCLHATQICRPSVRIYVPLPLMASLTGTIREAAAAGLRDVVAIVRELWRQGALVPGGVARFPGATSAPPSVGSHGWKAATAARAQAIAAGHGGVHKHLDASHRRLATFHEVLMSNPVLRQALLHLRTALPLLADMEAFERLCDLYGKQRTAIFHEKSNDGDDGASCSALPDVLFDARVGGEVRRTVRRMFAEVLRTLRLPPPRIQRTERKQRRRELEAQREAVEAEVASAPCTVAEALAQVAVKPQAPLRRRVAGELGALMRRRAIQGARERTEGPGAAAGSVGVGGGGCIGPRTNSGSRQQQRGPTLIRHRSELASAGLLGEDDLRAAAMPGIPPRVLRAEEERRQRVQTVAETWLTRQDRLMRREHCEVREEQQPQRVCQQRGDQSQKRPGKLTEGAAEAQRLASKGAAPAAPRSARVSQGRGHEARQARSDVPGTLVQGSDDGCDGEKDSDEGFDVDAELEAAFAEMEAEVDSPVDKKPLAVAVATTVPGQTTGEGDINGGTVPSATRAQGCGGNASGRGARVTRSNSRNPRCGRGAGRQGVKHPNKQFTPGADSSEGLTDGAKENCSKKKRGRGASRQGGVLPGTKPNPPSGVPVDVPGMRPRKRLKGTSTEKGLELAAAEDSGSGYNWRTDQATRVGAEGSRMAMTERKVGDVGGVSEVDELGTHDVLEHLGIADAELIRQTQLALKAQREAMELLLRIRPSEPHVRLAPVEVATQQQPPPSLLATDLPGPLQPGMPGAEPTIANAKANVGVLPRASRRRVATMPPLPPALAAPAQVGSGRQQQQKQQQKAKQPGAKSKAVGAAKKPSQPRKTCTQFDSGPGLQGENGALAGDMARDTAGPAPSVGTSSPAAGCKRRRREAFASTVTASNHKAMSDMHEAAGGGAGVLACDQSQSREGDIEGLGPLSRSGATTSPGQAIKSSQVAAGRANSALVDNDDDEDVLAAFDAMFSALKGLNALSSKGAEY